MNQESSEGVCFINGRTGPKREDKLKSSSENQRWLHFTQERFKPPSVWKTGKEELFQKSYILPSQPLAPLHAAPFLFPLCFASDLFLLHGRQSHTVSVLKGLLFLFGSHERFLQKSHMACLFSPLLFCFLFYVSFIYAHMFCP